MTTEQTITRTLRTVSEWLTNEGDKIMLLEVAANVESSTDMSWVCPVCEEIVCDDGCPLEEVRSRKG